ncbi:MAG: hypothetical protein ACI8SK_001591 [Shewanella sp.]|jgi:hypothetical protein
MDGGNAKKCLEQFWSWPLYGFIHETEGHSRIYT